MITKFNDYLFKNEINLNQIVRLIDNNKSYI